ncbi:hypothetical protein FB451DRAFT_1188678 [Mycena latifolia]|nr:hypothetical protein FB451DRAFT_1188678 [Mycena latifolia]
MSAAQNTPGASSSPPQGRGTTFQALNLSTNSDSSLTTAKAVTAGAECLPFPYAKGVFGTVVIILETVEKIKKNRDNLKELCGNIMEISRIIKDQLSSHGTTAAKKFKGLCEDFERVLQGVLKAVKQLHTEPRGFSGRFREVMRLSSTAEEISGYRTKIQELRLNFLLMAAIDTNLQVSKSLAALSRTVPSIQIPQFINNCPPPTRIFQGRQTILEKIHEYFIQKQPKQEIFLLHGLGGAGKTQIALKFIEESSSQFTDMFFIDASTIETIETSLKNIAKSKNVGETSQDALQWLKCNHDEWLLFFDNADDPKINLNDYFPQCSHGNIVITSRNPGLCVYASSHCAVSDMEEPDAVDLLLRSAAQDATDHAKETATQIVKVLHYLPLAIIQAGAFVSKSGNLDSYLALYSHNKARLLTERPAQSHDSYAWTVYTTWQISFDQLSERAKTFLKLCSCLHYEGITEEIFKNATNYRFGPSSPPKQALKMALKVLSQFLGPSGVWDLSCFMDITNEIRAYSLINFDATKNMFSIHPVVHDWAHNTLCDAGYYHCMVALAGMSLATLSEEELTGASIWMLPHIEFLMKGSSNVIPDFRHEYGKVYLFAGKEKRAEELQFFVLEHRRIILGEDHPDTVEAMYWLAWTYRQIGKLQQSVALAEKVVEKWKEILGDTHLSTLNAVGNLVLGYWEIGKLKEAEEIQIPLLQQWRNVFGDDHRGTLVAMGILAVLYDQLGKFKEAEELKVIVCEKYRDILGDSHPETLSIMGNLAVTYQNLGRLQEAEALGTLVLEKRRTILGDSHPGTLTSMGNLAVIYSRLGKLHNVEQLELEVLDRRKTILGDDHPNTLSAMGNLADTYSNLGRLQEAKELELEVLAKRKNILGNSHLQTLRTMSNLGSIFNKLEKWPEAEELLVEALEKQRQLLIGNHPYIIDSMQRLTVTYTKLGKMKEAEDLNVALKKS